MRVPVREVERTSCYANLNGDVDVASHSTPLPDWAVRGLEHPVDVDADHALVIANIKANSASRLEITDVSTEQSRSWFQVWTGGLQSQKGETVDIAVRLPSIKTLEVTGERGDIKISGAQDAWVFTRSGDIDVRSQTGPLSAETLDGDIDVTFERTQATKSDIATMNGDITVRGLSGPARIEGYNGIIDIEAANGAESVSVFSEGDVYLSLGSGYEQRQTKIWKTVDDTTSRPANIKIVTWSGSSKVSIRDTPKDR